jgi:DNA-binding XRE family transcriptional regulator
MMEMDIMIDKDRVRKFRSQHAWSQDHLASVSGLSLRTIQRIENDGGCSLESKKALAAVFNIKPSDLDIHVDAIRNLAASKRGCMFGFAGATAGLVCAYIGIILSLMSGQSTSAEAGFYYAAVGAFYGTCCGVIGALSNKRKANIA